MPLSRVTITDTHETTPPEHHEQDVIGFTGRIGRTGAGTVSDPYVTGSATPGALVSGTSMAQFPADVVGPASPVTDFLEAVFAQATPARVHWSPFAPDGDATAITAAMQLLKDNTGTVADDEPTILHHAGPETYDATHGGPLSMKLGQLADQMECRAYVNAPSASVAAAIAWSGGKTSDHVVGVLNDVNGVNAAYHLPGGYAIGAMLRNVADHNRARGLNFAPVRGVHRTRLHLSVQSDDFTTLDAAGIMTIARNGHHFQLYGGRFKYADANDPKTRITVARIRDYAAQRLDAVAQNFLSDTLSNSKCIDRLEEVLAPMKSARELLDYTVNLDAGRTTQSQRVFRVTLLVITPIEVVEIEILVTV